MRAFWLAIGFLTTLPIPKPGVHQVGDLKAASAFYPIAGYLLGAMLALTAWLTQPLPDGLHGAILLALWLGMTGLLHLDGLLDCADALWVANPPEQRLRILSDVHTGSFAFGVGFVHLLFKWQLLAADPSPWLLLCLPAITRHLVLFPMNLHPAAKPDGLGARSRGGPVIIATLFTFPALILFPWPALATLTVMLLIARWAAARLGGGLTGDVYGALIEIGETVGLLVGFLQTTCQ